MMEEGGGNARHFVPRPSRWSGPSSLRSDVLRSPEASLSNPKRGFSSTHSPPIKKAAERRPLLLVEAAGIEPASASPPLQALHAYPIL